MKIKEIIKNKNLLFSAARKYYKIKNELSDFGLFNKKITKKNKVNHYIHLMINTFFIVSSIPIFMFLGGVISSLFVENNPLKIPACLLVFFGGIILTNQFLVWIDKIKINKFKEGKNEIFSFTFDNLKPTGLPLTKAHEEIFSLKENEFTKEENNLFNDNVYYKYFIENTISKNKLIESLYDFIKDENNNITIKEKNDINEIINYFNLSMDKEKIELIYKNKQNDSFRIKKNKKIKCI
jgi:hypothetical protein